MTVVVTGKATVSIQGPLLFSDDSQPQPDIVLLKKRGDDYLDSLPTPADAVLLIEVADTTLDYDRNIKIPLYAQAGIPEVWLVNLKDNSVEVFRDPSIADYKLILRPDVEDSISPTQFPEFALTPKRRFG